MNKHGAIGVRSTDTGEISICAGANMPGEYGTLCGNSLLDDTMEEVEISDRARVNCSNCKSVWLEARNFKAGDFR
jgi:ribosomal protein L37AE/L43A